MKRTVTMAAAASWKMDRTYRGVCCQDVAGNWITMRLRLRTYHPPCEHLASV